jgi:hypothetical protein
VEDFIDDGIIQLAEGGIKREQAQRFKSTFDLLGTIFGSNALRRIDGDRPRGRVSLAAFECVAVGIGKNIDAISARQDSQQFVRKRVEEFWTIPELQNFFAPSLRGTIRIQRTIPFGERFFAP